MRVTPWLSLLGEYDGEQKHIGARFQTTKLWYGRIKFGGMISHNVTTKDNSVQFTISFYPEKLLSKNSVSNTVAEIDNKYQSNKKLSYSDLIDNLEREGLSDIKLYQKDDEVIVVEYENRVFRHNDFDAVYRVLAYASKLKGNF